MVYYEAQFSFTLGVFITAFIITSCSKSHFPPLKTVSYVDLNRFMGAWHVIANIPTILEKDAYNAIESYKLDKKGRIQTTFTFRKGSFSGEKKKYTPVGFVKDKKTNAEWGMQFIWPFKAEYLIIYLEEDYSMTVIGRTKRDYLWIMARSPEIPDKKYQEILNLLKGVGYNVSKVKMVPQKWN